MGWIPRYVVMGGMYGGARCPAGDLQILVNKMENHATNAVSIRMEGESYSLEQDYWKWGRAYGLNFTTLRTYIENHMDNTPHEFELFELEINNPVGAQFYKQSLVFWCSITAAEMTEGVGETDPLKYCYSTITITKVCRREYPTPYSAYVDTDLGVLQGGKIANIYRSGIKSYGGFWTRLLLDCYMPLGTFTYNDKNYFGFAIYMEDERADGYDYGTSFMLLGVDFEVLTTAFGGSFEPEEQTDPNEDPENPGNEEGGGDGDHNRPVDPIDVPPLPDLGASDAGFITMYRLTKTEMQSFANRFFATDILSAIKNFFSNPMEIFVGLGIIPFEPDASTMWYPLVGETYLSHQMLAKMDSQFWEIDCGSIHIEEYGKNCFDYAPFTKITIFLPYIGYRQLPVDEVMGKTISVKYHCDCLTGDCIAFISTQVMPQGLLPPVSVVIAEYNGNILTHCPVASQSFDSAVSAAISLACAGVGMIAGDAIGGVSPEKVGTQASQLISSTSSIVAGLKPNVKRDGAIAAAAGYMGVQKPYIIREIPNQSLPDNYHSFFGYPSNISGTLNDGFSGFTVVEDIQLNDIPAMETERAEIMELLGKGVII
ncbi:MAG: hypothetical protein J6S67_10415 [Methanobrevibacter sp.]|nr:hypothetical protein [Methanobrevibacter sp.]